MFLLVWSWTLTLCGCSLSESSTAFSRGDLVQASLDSREESGTYHLAGSFEISASSLSPSIDVVNVTVVPAGSYTMPAPDTISATQESAAVGKGDHSVVISSWALLALIGNYGGHIQQHEFPWLVSGFKNAVADSLEVCRASVNVVDMHAVNVDFIVDPEPVPRVRDRWHHASLINRIQQLMRSSKERPMRHVNMTQVKAVYEVRIFPEMRRNGSEVARRIDNLQTYSKFSDLNRMLAKALVRDSSDGVVLDDIGYAARHELHRSALTKTELSNCVEEEMLHDARRAHQYIVILSLILVALTTCVGSAVFTIKHPSHVPSRMNPLAGVAS